ncbi:MAG: hypothetical protein U5Q03_14625 [Bacteroidota bacterium]|nr:hypothetical protein [Bacteroidota bacterium]
MRKRYLIILMIMLGVTGMQAQIDSLNPGLAKDCIRSLNFSDRMFEEGNFDISYKYWQNGFRICDKDIGSGIYFLGEALLEYRLFQLGPQENKQVLLDSLVQLIEERKERYGNELQLKGQQPFSATKKMNALKVFYGINEKCEYIRFGKETTGEGFSIETFPTLLWEDYYHSIAVALDKDNMQVRMNLIIDLGEKFDIEQGDILELQLQDGTKIILKADKDASSVGLQKFDNLVYRARATYYLDLKEAAFLSSKTNLLAKIVLNTRKGKISKTPQYPEQLADLMRCLKL